MKTSTPSVASLTSGPSVALGSAPLMRHKMTFSHFSKDLIRPLSQGEKVDVTSHPSHIISSNCPPETGGESGC